MEGHAVEVGLHGQSVGAHLVGEVAVGGYPVRAHQHPLHFAVPQQQGGHAVRDEGGGDAQTLELPGREAATLQEGPGLVRVDMEALTLLVGPTDDTQGRADACGG